MFTFTTPERSELHKRLARLGRIGRNVGLDTEQAALPEAIARRIRERRARAVLRAAEFHRRQRQRAH
jgi:hypothetical protein